jgi:hypothetical protein
MIAHFPGFVQTVQSIVEGFNYFYGPKAKPV